MFDTGRMSECVTVLVSVEVMEQTLSTSHLTFYISCVTFGETCNFIISYHMFNFLHIGQIHCILMLTVLNLYVFTSTVFNVLYGTEDIYYYYIIFY
jgi:hypothetical protein